MKNPHWLWQAVVNDVLEKNSTDAGSSLNA